MSAADRRLRVPATLEDLAALRRFVRASAGTMGADPDAVDDLVQAVDEAAANVVVHGYAGRPGDIEVDISLADGAIVVRLLDRAPVFDPTSAPDPDMRVPALVRGPHGMGIRLIRLATDAQAYEPRSGGGNVLTLRRSPKPRTSKEA